MSIFLRDHIEASADREQRLVTRQILSGSDELVTKFCDCFPDDKLDDFIQICALLYCAGKRAGHASKNFDLKCLTDALNERKKNKKSTQ